MDCIQSGGVEGPREKRGCNGYTRERGKRRRKFSKKGGFLSNKEKGVKKTVQGCIRMGGNKKMKVKQKADSVYRKGGIA